MKATGKITQPITKVLDRSLASTWLCSQMVQPLQSKVRLFYAVGPTETVL